MPRARLLGLLALLAIPFAPAAGRASTLSSGADEIYRVDPNGHQIDLSRSSAEDDSPLVSPDGKRVAFYSSRGLAPGRHDRIYEMRIDGTHVKSMAPALSGVAAAGTLAWQPHGDRLAFVSAHNYRYQRPSKLWILRRGHEPQRVLTGGVLEPSWSPDGRVLLAWSHQAWRAFSPTGRRLWVHGSANYGGCCGSSWSSQGLLAITTLSQIRVYAEGGRKLFAAPVPKGRVSPPTWSPSGRTVAFVAGGVLEVRTANGRLMLRKTVPELDPDRPNIVVWADDHRLVAGLPGTGPQEGVNEPSGTSWNASGLWFNPRSANGKLAIVTQRNGSSFTIGVEPVAGGPIAPYTMLPACTAQLPTVDSLQFVGRSRSIVYDDVCNETSP